MAILPSLPRLIVRRSVIVIIGLLIFALIVTKDELAWSADPSAPTTARATASISLDDTLKTLEAKAVLANGTWTIRSGPQSRPAQEWTITLKGTAWHLNTTTRPTADPFAGAIFSDGKYTYSLDQNVRFNLNTLIRHRNTEYSAIQMIFMANFAPQQLLGALGTADVGVGETIDGVTSIRIHVTPGSSSALSTNSTYRTGYDFYYDPRRQAIFRVRFTVRDMVLTDCRVKAWESFGTTALWPSSIDGTLNPQANGSPAPPIATATTVEGLSSNVTSVVQEDQDRLSKSTFVGTAHEDLHAVEFYQHSLQSNPNLSDQVALAEAEFVANNVEDGFTQWASLRKSATQSSSDAALNHILSQLAANAIWDRAKDKAETADCVRGMELLNQFLSDDEWSAASSATFQAYRLLATTPAAANQVKQLTPLLDRFARSKQVPDIFGMILLEKANTSLAAAIETALNRVINTHVKISLAENPAMAILNAAIQLGDMSRAQTYIATLRAASDLPNDNAELSAIATCASVGLRLRGENGLRVFPEAIRAVSSLKSTIPTADRETAFTMHQWLLTSMTVPVRDSIVKDRLSDVVEAFKQSVGIPDASQVWEHVLASREVSSIDKDSQLLQLAKVCEDTFRVSGVQSLVFSELADKAALLKSGSPPKAIAYYEKALNLAPNDASRLSILTRLSALYCRLRQFDQARKVVDASAYRMDSVEGKTEIRSVLQMVQGQQALANKSIANNQLAQTRRHLEGQLQYLQDRLHDAELRKLSDNDIASLRQLIQKTQLAMKDNSDDTLN